ncbi:MAG: hypothetical protein LBJ18_01885 [Rickettsiales bacterium]|nr:hypothetical protein [Rickettsiales bacterium]
MDKLDLKITKLANRGARRAQEKARKAGVPVVYAINGVLVKQMPDGKIKAATSK